jgi:hypothetical protein
MFIFCVNICDSKIVTIGVSEMENKLEKSLYQKKSNAGERPNNENL